MAADSDPQDAFWEAIRVVEEHLAAQVHSSMGRVGTRHEQRHVHEVVGGLLARQATSLAS